MFVATGRKMKTEREPGTKKRKRSGVSYNNNRSGATAKIRTAITNWFGEDSHEITLSTINNMIHGIHHNKIIHPALPEGMTRLEAKKLMKSFHRLYKNRDSARRSRVSKKKRFDYLEAKSQKYDVLMQRANMLQKDQNILVLEIQKLKHQFLGISNWLGIPHSNMIQFTEEEIWFSNMVMLPETIDAGSHHHKII